MVFLHARVADELLHAVEGGKPTIVHHWAPWVNRGSPIAVFLRDMAAIYEDEIDFVLVTGSFAIEPLTYDDLPITVLYIDGAARATATVDWRERGLIGTRDIFDLVNIALDHLENVASVDDAE